VEGFKFQVSKSYLPQVAETPPPQPMDAAGEGVLYADIELQIIKKEQFTTFRYHDVGEKGHILRLAVYGYSKVSFCRSERSEEITATLRCAQGDALVECFLFCQATLE
jgi:hypothetical protein